MSKANSIIRKMTHTNNAAPSFSECLVHNSARSKLRCCGRVSNVYFRFNTEVAKDFGDGIGIPVPIVVHRAHVVRRRWAGMLVSFL